MDIIFGRNTVKAAIKSGRSLDKILAAKDIADPSVREILALAAAHSIPVVRVDKRKLDSMTMEFGYGEKPANHQGVVAVAAAKDYGTIDDILGLAQSRGEPPFIIILDGITDEGNLGSIIRSAEVLGAHGIILCKRRSASLSAVAFKASSGAAELLPVAKVTNLSAAIKELKGKGVWIAAADVTGEDAQTAALSGAIAIVIGSEGEGISRLVLENCDLKVRIPMKGSTGSLNASVAAAVLMYEKQRQDKHKC
ncbi:MAG: 23S rRNA (guanosine(2251)-2'-O)-methyltransferase RlmB [Eubacteriales bacterium]|nr:23S rRNA (guanosine(2251)-2'-O)-methyltransferase RlmB [Eubacteriales bacterium]